MIQIYGAGISGTYLHTLLENSGIDVHIYDVKKEPDCRCGWAINYKEAKKLYKEIGINIDDYVTAKPENIVVNKIWLKNKNIVTFNKKKLLEDFWRNLKFNFGEGRIIIDATGTSRAKLPPIKNDRLLPTYQTLEVHRGIDTNFFIHFGGSGYAWAFPISENLWHIGAGDIDPRKIHKHILMLRREYGFDEDEVKCMCRAKIRMMRPTKCLPFIYNNTIGVGEAIGCVSGAGEGNVPSLISAKILFECINQNNLNDYEKRIISELSWVENEQKFVDYFLNNRKIAAIKLLPKIVSHESKRSVEHTLKTIMRILRL
ncbi:MAG TPA: NAD(P)/FAD-dependent oxidoreductase [Archaeoglobus sp.]|nr:NAD(P)/FAD-dependent oxidoreductase [Archaeoglobus sp.]